MGEDGQPAVRQDITYSDAAIAPFSAFAFFESGIVLRGFGIVSAVALDVAVEEVALFQSQRFAPGGEMLHLKSIGCAVPRCFYRERFVSLFCRARLGILRSGRQDFRGSECRCM
jgi:hypothetical protein